MKMEEEEKMICHITVMTEKMEETIEFYQWLLGLPINQRFPYGQGGEIVFLGEEETKYELIYEPGRELRPGGEVTIGFAVDNLDDKMMMLDERKVAHSPTISPGPYARFCYFTDINGTKIQLFEGR